MNAKNTEDSVRNAYIACGREKTLRHAESVGETAARLASIHNLDADRARLASLLHDVSVIIPPDEMLRSAKKRDMPIDPAEEKYPFLLHQRISRIIAEETFGVRDPVILDAVECHTTLKKNAGPYDKLVFIADKLSWDREGIPPYYEALKRMAEKSLDEACFYFIDYQFRNRLLLMPHRWIREAYEDLKERMT